MDNHVHNLVTQLAQENKSLWRIKNSYIADSDGCGECGAFWEKMVADKEAHVKELSALVKGHLS